jgi:hypothetical protein
MMGRGVYRRYRKLRERIKGDYKAEIGGMKEEDEEVTIPHTNSRLRYLRKEQPKRVEELERVGETHSRMIKCRFGQEEGALITNLGEEIEAPEIRELYRGNYFNKYKCNLKPSFLGVSL